MSRKYKTTGCAKFFFVLIILAPLAYMGASYYNGQDGWANLKGLFGGSSKVESNVEEEGLQDEIKELKQDLQALEAENKRLTKALEDCEDATKE